MSTSTLTSTNTIQKTSRDWRVTPNLLNYEEARQSFSWSQARQLLDGLPNHRGLNMAYEAVDRHACGVLKNHIAIRWIGRSGLPRDYSYADLQQQTNRFANVLRNLNIKAAIVSSHFVDEFQSYTSPH